MSITPSLGRNDHDSDTHEPLIQQQQQQLHKEVAVRVGSDLAGSAGGGGGRGTLLMVLLSTAVAVCGSFEFGACLGYTAPTQATIMKELGLSLFQYSVFGSILTIGAMVGAIISGTLADYSGRKGAMGISAVACLIGWIAIFFAQGPLLLCFGRFISGCGIGVFSYVVPIFIAEIAPKDFRGGLTTLNQLLISAGDSVILIVGTFVTWRALVLYGFLPCIILCFGIFFIPESPRWLAKMGREKEFEVSLRRLRGKNANIFEEVSEIKEYSSTSKAQPKASFLDLFQKKYLHSIVVSVGLMLFQQFGGINGIAFYASEIFVSAGFSDGNLGTILLGSVQVPLTTLGAFLIDRSGRRPLLLVSSAGCSIGCAITGISFLLQGQGMSSEWLPTLALVGILVFKGAYSLGMGAIPWIIMSEIFPFHIKGIAGSLVTLVSWFGSWVTTYAFNFLLSWSPAGTFFMFAVVSASTVLFVVKVVPETKGRSLEEIQASLNSSFLIQDSSKDHPSDRTKHLRVSVVA